MFKTEQESFWHGDFGNEYILRNQGNYQIVSANIRLFAKILERTSGIESVIEFGSNIGLNLVALNMLLNHVFKDKKDALSAIEINENAGRQLKENVPGVNLYNMSILDFKPDYQRDFVLIKGVLIHINPDELQTVYELLYKTSKKYICIAEYYNPSPVEVVYRNHTGKLFKRDFAGEFMDKFSDVKLIDYGFVYHRDNMFPADDVTWFLLEKQ